MRTAIKKRDSLILVENLTYQKNSSANNKKIAAILMEEQSDFCAYTDEYISRTDARDIEHFNPNYKYTADDSYYNWFVVKTQWNKEKSQKWEKFQPVLHPTSDLLEERITYEDGIYSANKTDVDARNLIILLKLNDPILVDKRKRYIARKKRDIIEFGIDPFTFFAELLNADPCQLSYPRAIKEEFKVDIFKLISNK